MEIGTMRERITIQKSAVKIDNIGNHTAEWTDFYSCWAYVNNLSGREYWEAAQVNEQTSLYFLIRWCERLSALDTVNYRVRFRNEMYNITFVDNVQYRNKILKLRAERIKR